jgi:hypothetical protein
MIDFNQVEVTAIEGIDFADYPDFCDAYVSEELIAGVPATEAELEEIQENSSFFYDALTDYIH